MITRLSLRNFQSHKATSLELDPGVNVIIGPSDSGKSAIIRGLRWLVWNKPGGDSFRSTWGGETQVTARVEKYINISRTRSNKENSYSIFEEGHYEPQGFSEPPQSMEFKAFGAEPPEEVRRLLNLDEVNLQSQLARPFLLDSSPGQVAQYLNSVARLDVIDLALSRVNKWIRGIDGDTRAKRQRIEELEQTEKEYSYLADMEKDVAELEAQEVGVQATREQRRRLDITLGQLGQVDRRQSSLQSLVELQPLVTNLLAKYQEYDAIETKRISLKSSIIRLRKLDEGLRELAGLKALKPAVDRVFELREQIESKSGRLAKLAGIIDKIEQNGRDKTNLMKRIGEMHKTFDKEMGDRCILCGTKR